MSVYSQLHVEVASKKHNDLKIIAIKAGKNQKELIDEALDYLSQKYKEFLGK